MTPDLRQLLATGTPEPWRIRDGYYICIQGEPREGERYGDLVTSQTGQVSHQRGYGRDNAALIVALRNQVPALLDELDALRAQLTAALARNEALTSACERARDQFAFYADEHGKAGKHEKRLTNEAVVGVLERALLIPKPDGGRG